MPDPQRLTLAQPQAVPEPKLRERAEQVRALDAVRSATVVGVDIGAGSAKAVVLEGRARSNTIFVRETLVLPIIDPDEGFDATLRKLLRKLRTRSRECALATWPASAQIRLFTDDSGKALAGRTRGLGGDAVDGDSDYIFDAAQIPTTKAKNQTTVVLKSGMLREDLQRIDEAFRAVGYQLSLVQLTPIAIYNAFYVSQQEIASHEPYLAVDFGRNRTTLVGGSNGAVRLMRVIDRGWDHVSEPLDLELGLDCRENLQRLPCDDPHLRASVADAMEAIARELALSLDHLQMEHDGVRPVRLHISGPLDAESLPVQVISDYLGIAAVQWNPLRRATARERALTNFQLLSDLSRLPAATGAALQCLL